MILSSFVGILSGRRPRPIAKPKAALRLNQLEDRAVPASLGAALNYNLLAFGNLTVPTGSDTEGRVAVGGTATFQSNYVIGAPPPNSSPEGAQLPLDSTRDDLVVGTNIVNSGGYAWVANGNAVYQGTYSGTPIQHAAGTTRQQNPVLIAADGNAVTSGGQSFTDLKTELREKSAAWSTLSDQGVSLKYSDSSTLNLKGTSATLNVFNVTADQWAGNNRLRNITAPVGSTVLINVSGTSITSSGGNMLLDGVDREHVLVNFFQATTITSTNLNYQASVLAPLADVTFNGGILCGNGAFGGNVTQGGGFEFHNFKFKGDVPTPTPPGSAVHHGQTATIGFWNNKNGQALIRSFNGGATSTALGNWLASNFPHIYGAQAGSYNLAGKTNDYIAQLFTTDFKVQGQKLDAQVLGVALGVYASTSSLGGNAGVKYGFEVTAGGLGAATYNVGSSGAAFGVANNTTLTVMQILKAADAQAVNGVLYGGNTYLRNLANTVFDGINQKGDI